PPRGRAPGPRPPARRPTPPRRPPRHRASHRRECRRALQLMLMSRSSVTPSLRRSVTPYTVTEVTEVTRRRKDLHGKDARRTRRLAEGRTAPDRRRRAGGSPHLWQLYAAAAAGSVSLQATE